MPLKSKIRGLYRRLGELRRLPYRLRYRRQLRARDFTLLTNNCLGGLLYHELGLPFLSPLINIYMNNGDFLRLCGDLERYMAEPLAFFRRPGTDCPVAKLGELTIKFPHESSEASARANWERRRARIRYDNLYVIFLDIGNATAEELAAFDALPQKNRLYVRHAAGEHGGRDWFEAVRGSLSRRGYDAFPLIAFLNDPAAFAAPGAAGGPPGGRAAAGQLSGD